MQVKIYLSSDEKIFEIETKNLDLFDKIYPKNILIKYCNLDEFLIIRQTIDQSIV